MTVRTGSHQSHLNGSIVLQPGISHHRIFLVIKRVKDFHCVKSSYRLNPDIRHRFFKGNHAPVRSLMRHHRTQIVFAVYKLDSGLDVVFMVNAQHQTCLVKALLIFSGNLDFHLKLASVSGIIKRCVVYGKSVM